MLNDQNITEFEITHKLKIPSIYAEFLKKHNGFTFDGGMLLYSLDDIEEMNEAQQIQHYQPNCIAIGDNGGGLMFLMKQEDDAKEVFIVDMGDCDINTAFLKIDNFQKWFNTGCTIVDSNETDCDLVNVYLIKNPINGIKDLVKIKNIFSINTPSKQFLGLSRELPCLLISDINYYIAKKLIEKVGQTDIFKIEK